VEQAYQGQALEAVRADHEAYFTALEAHPRLLVGTEVPRLDGKEGNEVLRTTEDAKDWQDAVKGLLVQEVRGRAAKAMDEQADYLTTIHASIDLFKNNVDLIPGTKDFDVELANEFAKMAAPYELRIEEKLQGYSIPVQPLIDQIRDKLVADRAAKASASTAAAGTTASPDGKPAATKQAGQSSTPADQPQAGIQSKAGQSDSAEDFSTLFGTIGLPNLQI
jgi:hypothetical protein